MSFIEKQKLFASDKTTNNNFGCSISTYNDTCIVGADYVDLDGISDTEVAYIFKLVNKTWTQQQKLATSDKVIYDYLGNSVSMYNDTCIIGTPNASPDGISNAGAAYIFKLVDKTWVQQQKLVASDKATNDYFGASVSIYNDTCIIGAHGSDPGGTSNAGAAYIFKLINGIWVQQQKLTASDKVADDQFGASVSIYNDRCIIGAYRADSGDITDTGAAYIFKLIDDIWVQQQKIVASDRIANDHFGYSVSIYNDTCIVGAYKADPGGIYDAGAAYTFKLINGIWVQQQKLSASDKASNNYFGNSVSIYNDTCIIGAYSVDPGSTTNVSAAYIFKLVDGTWIQQQKLVTSDKTTGDWFGILVNIYNDAYIIGAPDVDIDDLYDIGVIYISKFVENPLTQENKSIASDKVA